ncbi:hypothetical protein ABVT39_007956 [Epinephelus coioides]
MDAITTLVGTLQQTLMSVKVQLGYEEPHGLVVSIYLSRERLAVISITRLLMVIFNIREEE